MRLLKILVGGLFLLAVGLNVSFASTSPSGIHLNVKEFSLHNGMLFLVVERPMTPQVACRLAIRAGSALEETGRTGIAHMLEHMMFKGTKNFGTTDYRQDRELQRQIEAAYQTIKEEQRRRHPDQALISAKKAEMKRLRGDVQKIYVPLAFSSQLGKNGAVGTNAFTSMDQTQYITSVPSDMLEQWFSVVSEQLFEPSWREFYLEKEVVEREWAYRYVNNPNGAAWLDLNALTYTAHPYRNPVIGWKTDIEKFSTKDAKEYHAKYYNPANTVCVLVGDLTIEKAKKFAERYFGRYPAGRRAPETVTREPRQEGPRKSVRYFKGARTPLVRIGFHAPPMGEKEFYALDALTMILSYGRSARFNQNIINQGLAIRAWAANLDNRYGGMVVLGGTPIDPADLSRDGISTAQKRQIYLEAAENLEKILLGEAEKLKTAVITKKELERIKKLNQREFLEKMRSNEHLAGTLATFEVQFGWNYMMTYLDNIAAVTPDDIRRAAKKYVRDDVKNSVYVIPGGRPDQPPERYKEDRSVTGSHAARLMKPISLNNNSIYPTPEGWRHPLSFERRPEKIAYPKAETAFIEGAKVFYLPDRELPLIDLTIIVKAGAVDIDDSKVGLAGILSGSLIRGGTAGYAPSDLARLLDENAIRLSFSVGEEKTAIELSVMKADWEKALSILGEIINHPRFDPKVLEVIREQALTALKRQGGDAQAVAMREWKVWHFKGHPYGRDPLVGLKTIPNINQKDLKDFLRTWFVPSNMVVSVSGDIEKEKVVEGLNVLFKSLRKGKVPSRDLGDPPGTPPVLALIHKPGQMQTQISMGLPGIKRTHPDYWKMSLLMNVFGGRDSLLYSRLRNDLGLVYSAGFFQTYKWTTGFLIGYIGCKGDKTVEAIRETVKVIKDLKQEVPEKEIEQKRLDALNSFVFNVDTPAALVGVYGNYHIRKEPLDTLERIQDAYINATKQDLERLAGQLLDPEKLQIVVVGDRETWVRTENDREVTLEDDLKILANDLGLPYTEIPLR